MDKNKKKPASAASKGAKRPSDYKSREADGKTNPSDLAFQKAFGKSKDISRKG